MQYIGQKDMFPQIIRDLISRGWTQDLLALDVGVAQSAISSYLSHGRQPAWSTGNKLINLHRNNAMPGRKRYARNL